MDKQFNIYIDHLRDGSRESIDESFSPEFMDINEAELAIQRPVEVRGETYIAGDILVLQLSLATEATMPCAICNSDAQVKLEVPEMTHTVELSSIKGGIFNFKELIRESLLLELPHTAECNEGHCPERKVLEKFSSKRGQHTPFSEL
ncbi:MAG: hypothetical protein K1000chlam4_00216 [Chlamydiae bacterium]|nr:hypothetical protein [Chlamydiota bacterium]